MLERTSRFVLEVLPYLLTAIIAAVVVPGFIYSQVHGTKATTHSTVPGLHESALELIRRDHAAVEANEIASGRPAKSVKDKL